VECYRSLGQSYYLEASRRSSCCTSR
jgi:hypothetical protein